MRRMISAFALTLTVILPLNQVYSQDNDLISHNVLYINSYGITFPWADSVTAGILNVFMERNDVQLFVEHLDAKRFGKDDFDELYSLFLRKYRHINFDVAIASDNDALDFLIEYGDSLIPDIPVAFCGINNPEDYHIENTRFYGIKEGVDQDSVIQLILRLIPSVKKLYFISDSSTTSLVNINNIKKIELEYINQLQFEYINHIAVDSLMSVVSRFEKGNAIALINYFQDLNGNPINFNNLVQEIAQDAPVPIFLDSETLIGKGILGGIINNGSAHGREVANLALQFIDKDGYTPDARIALPKDNYYFDYHILKKFNIPETLLPSGSIIINKPQTVLVRYLRYVVLLLGIISFLLLTVLLLVFNIRRRKKAENIVHQKLMEIEQQNVRLENANKLVIQMNNELEKINKHLSIVNEELKTAKEKSDESDRLKSAFLANMSHEIRTPLNAIIGFSSILADPSTTKEELEQYVRIINSNGNQLIRIIDDILDLSKIEAGQLKVLYELFSANEMINDSVHSFRKNNINHLVKISISPFVKKCQLMLLSDPSRFKQIIDNLLSNAIKFTNKGKVEIGFTLDNSDEVTFFVKDTGIGIENKHLNNIFSRFWKVEEYGNKLYSGTGLGLAISRKLCEMLGGRIWLESDPGKGSIFYFTLPNFILKEDKIKDSVHTADNIQYDWKGYTIVVAEDESSNLQLLFKILKSLNTNVIGFKDGNEIVDFFRKNPDKAVDLILMDIKMPGMDGYKASKLIRNINPNIPIIAQTAYAMDDDVARLKEADFDDFITKPIKTGQLIEKISKLMIQE